MTGLSGPPTPGVGLSPTSIDFGSVKVGKASTVHTVTVTKGTRTAVLRIADNAPDSPQSVPLSVVAY